MSVHKLKDGRWIVKYPDPEKPGGSRREYFGRGDSAKKKAGITRRLSLYDLRHFFVTTAIESGGA